MHSDLIIGFSALIETLVCGRALLNATRKCYWKQQHNCKDLAYRQQPLLFTFTWLLFLKVGGEGGGLFSASC